MSELPHLMDLLQRTAAWLGDKGIANARRETEWIFGHVLGLDRLQLYTRYDMLLDPDQVDALRAAVRRRGQREPLAYVLGSQPFCGLDLAVDAAVLVPRPETEELVERVCADETLPARAQAVDVGTGSGAIALALKQARPDWSLTATDNSDAALAVARANAERHRLAVDFVHTHLLDGLDGPWDLVVANLPYIAVEEAALCDPETAHEPRHALWADDGGMALIHELIAVLPGCLAAQGVVWLEHGFAQGDRVVAALTAIGFEAVIHRDGNGQPRCTRGVRCG